VCAGIGHGARLRSLGPDERDFGIAHGVSSTSVGKGLPKRMWSKGRSIGWVQDRRELRRDDLRRSHHPELEMNLNSP
jgi:hypothetical protein